MSSTNFGKLRPNMPPPLRPNSLACETTDLCKLKTVSHTSNDITTRSMSANSIRVPGASPGEQLELVSAMNQLKSIVENLRDTVPDIRGKLTALQSETMGRLQRLEPLLQSIPALEQRLQQDLQVVRSFRSTQDKVDLLYSNLTAIQQIPMILQMAQQHDQDIRMAVQTAEGAARSVQQVSSQINSLRNTMQESLDSITQGYQSYTSAQIQAVRSQIIQQLSQRIDAQEATITSIVTQVQRNTQTIATNQANQDRINIAVEGRLRRCEQVLRI